MKKVDYAKEHGNHCTITVDASPGANRTEIVGTNPWRNALHIKVAAHAKDGEANAELVRFLAKKLSVPANTIRLMKGERSPLKVILLPVTAAQAREILGGD